MVPWSFLSSSPRASVNHSSSAAGTVGLGFRYESWTFTDRTPACGTSKARGAFVHGCVCAILHIS